MAVVVQLVVGELELVKGDHLLHPLRTLDHPPCMYNVYQAGLLESSFIHLEKLVYYVTKRKAHLSRRIWVNMDPWRRVGIGLASHHPA